jgi:hypothetical protein
MSANVLWRTRVKNHLLVLSAVLCVSGPVACGVPLDGDASVSDGAETGTVVDGGTRADTQRPIDDAMSSPDAGDFDAPFVEDNDAATGDDAMVEIDTGVESADAATRDAGRADSGSGDSGTPAHTCPATLPRLDLRADFGAVGDGVADDTDALHRAAVAIQRAGGGELTIPPGTYRIGRQARGAMTGQPFYRPADMFNVDGVSCLQISGYGATLRLTSGLHYGAFDPMTGEPIPGPTTNRAAAAAVGRMIQVTDSSNILIEGLELDGNNTALVLGGQWGDVDRQTAATGILLNRDRDARVVDVHTHHHGLDGIAVEYQPGAPSMPMPNVLERVNSEYNGRQGISWIGGWGLYATDCQFNHTGRAINHGGGVGDGMPLQSRPRAGLDIEPNAGTTEVSRDGQFTRCEFVDNSGAGMVAAVGNGGYSTFTDCTFWGTTSYSVWANRPGLRFVNSHFYGTGSHASDGHTDADPNPNPDLATVFDGCTFEDRPWTDGRVYRANVLYEISAGGDGATFRNCTFRTHSVRSVWMDDPATHEIFDGCTFEHGASGLSSGTYQAYFRGSRLTSCHFTETDAVSSGRNNYFLNVSGVVVRTPAAGGDPTHVDGPRVHWQSTSGPTGDIAPGMY